jgi:hypothetical protein
MTTTEMISPQERGESRVKKKSVSTLRSQRPLR